MHSLAVPVVTEAHPSARFRFCNLGRFFTKGPYGGSVHPVMQVALSADNKKSNEREQKFP